MLQVLFLPKWYPSKPYPLEGIFIRRHAEAVSLFAHVHVLYAIADPELKGLLFHLETNKVNDHLTEHRWYYKKSFTGYEAIDRVIKTWLYFFCMLKGYFALKKQYGKMDLLHVHILLRNGLFALLVSFYDHLKIVYTEHWSGYHPENGDYKGWLRGKLTQLFFRHTSTIMPVTQHLANRMQSHGLHGHYTVVPNVVDTHLFVPSPIKSLTGKKTVFHISNFAPAAKNVKGLLEVVAKVAKLRDDFEVWIIGDSPERISLEEKANQLSLLNKSVFFKGMKEGQELIQLIHSADFLFMFSSYENQPCVIIEAMACGKPVLATHTGGIPELVSSTRGLLSPPNDEVLMADKLNTMLDSYSTFSPDELRQFAVLNFSYEKVGQQILDVYLSTIAA